MEYLVVVPQWGDVWKRAKTLEKAKKEALKLAISTGYTVRVYQATDFAYKFKEKRS
jgi:hypothetical protein